LELPLVLPVVDLQALELVFVPEPTDPRRYRIAVEVVVVVLRVPVDQTTSHPVMRPEPGLVFEEVVLVIGIPTNHPNLLVVVSVLHPLRLHMD
jgi:hypothetical protein